MKRSGQSKIRVNTRRALLFVAIFIVAAGGGLFLVAAKQANDKAVAVASAARKVEAEQVAAKAKALAEAEAKKKEPVYFTLPGAEPVRALVEDITTPRSTWKLVNKERDIPIDYAPELVSPDVPIRPNATADEQKVSAAIAGPVKELFNAAQQSGYSLMIGSAYRSGETQRTLFASYVANAGLEEAQKYSARPGHSEHQLGLAVDISNVSQACYLSECFLGTPEGTWLADNAYKYGFTLRYKKGKEAMTGYNFEPWHYRYVGIELTTALHASDYTLEEAWPYMSTAMETLQKNKAL